MSKTKNIVAISGSLRKNSSNQVILDFIKGYCKKEAVVNSSLDLQKLPHFDPSMSENEVPPEVQKFRSTIEAADGIIICTPEYVFSLPAVLKNALEWTVSTTVFQNKPTALIVAATSGEKALVSLKLIMQTLGSSIEDHTNLLIKGVKGKIKDQQFTDDPTLLQIQSLTNSLTNKLS